MRLDAVNTQNANDIWLTMRRDRLSEMHGTKRIWLTAMWSERFAKPRREADDSGSVRRYDSKAVAKQSQKDRPGDQDT